MMEPVKSQENNFEQIKFILKWLDKSNPVELQNWQKLVDKSPFGDILQYPQWGQIKESEYWCWQILGVYQDNQIIAGAMILSKKIGINLFGLDLSIGKYAYCPDGPIIDFGNQYLALEIVNLMVDFFKKHATTLQWVNLEIEPKMGTLPIEEIKQLENQNELKNLSSNQPLEESVKNKLTPNLMPFIADFHQIFLKAGFKVLNRNMQPKYKLLYDLDKSQEELLSLCNKTTRYNIKLAQKKGVVINQYLPDNPQIDEKLKIFYDLLLLTQERTKGYPIRSFDSFQKMFKLFKQGQNISLFEASYQGQVIAMNISQRTGYWASSFYAASNRLHNQVKAPYLLRWHSILKAKEMGCKIYDFWGIIPDNVASSKQHKGYSDHKLGFGGVRIDNFGLLSLEFNPLKAKIWHLMISLRTKLAIFIQNLRF